MPKEQNETIIFCKHIDSRVKTNLKIEGKQQNLCNSTVLVLFSGVADTQATNVKILKHTYTLSTGVQKKNLKIEGKQQNLCTSRVLVLCSGVADTRATNVKILKHTYTLRTGVYNSHLYM